jgi:hypothetical protein
VHVLVYRFNFFICAVSALAYTPLDEVQDYYKALIDEELPLVLEDIRSQLETEEDDPVDRFSDIQKSIEKFLDYVESTYIGKVEIRTETCRVLTEICRNPDNDDTYEKMFF